MLRRLLNNKTSTTTTTSVCNIRRRLRAKAYYFTMATTTNTTTTTITKDYDSALKLLETLIVTKPKEERAPDVRQVCNVTAMNDYLKRLNLKVQCSGIFTYFLDFRIAHDTCGWYQGKRFHLRHVRKHFAHHWFKHRPVHQSAHVWCTGTYTY